MTDATTIEKIALSPEKFRDPERTADGTRRASVMLNRLDTLWINTGTLCNIECAHCYIESSPTNDRLAYISKQEAESYFDEIVQYDLGTREIGLTGGEPFMNPDCCAIMEAALERGFDVLALTNAMQPMLRPRIREELQRLNGQYKDHLTLRVSLDHYTKELHEAERGADTWLKTIEGLRWLSKNGVTLNVAGRTCWGETEDVARAGYGRLFDCEGISVNAEDPAALVLFPEMDETADVPEITDNCWALLGVNPNDMMCASSRMVVKRKGASSPTVLPCTLLPYDGEFEMGRWLRDAQGSVNLNHPHCAKFCVLGGGSCSVAE